MKDLRLPRVLLVTRPTQLELLLERHGTFGQAAFFLRTRGQDIARAEVAHATFEAALRQVEGAIPSDQRRTRLTRALLDRFVFAPDDLILLVGQDGLVANAAKYLHGQLAIGINSDPRQFDGVLCRHHPQDTAALLAWTRNGGGTYQVEERTMAVARRDDGLELLALNEIFVGHRTHQSARYRIRYGGRDELHSSSGLIAATGTGATGWASSVVGQRAKKPALPGPGDPRLVFLVREPFRSVSTGTKLAQGAIDARSPLRLDSEMGEGGVVFADGIESDFFDFLAGQSLEIGIAGRVLRLLVGAGEAASAPPALERGRRNGGAGDQEARAGR